jgi:hypothetical protein
MSTATPVQTDRDQKISRQDAKTPSFCWVQSTIQILLLCALGGSSDSSLGQK